MCWGGRKKKSNTFCFDRKRTFLHYWRESINKKIFWQSSRLHGRSVLVLDLCLHRVQEKKGKKNNIALYQSRRRWTQKSGSWVCTVRKHVCVNCDGGNRSFTQLHMSRARWILLTALKWILHFLSPVTFREAATLKFSAIWQFQTNSRGPAAEACLGCPQQRVKVITRRYLSRKWQDPLGNPTPHQSVWVGGDRKGGKGRKKVVEEI